MAERRHLSHGSTPGPDQSRASGSLEASRRCPVKAVIPWRLLPRAT